MVSAASAFENNLPASLTMASAPAVRCRWLDATTPCIGSNGGILFDQVGRAGHRNPVRRQDSAVGFICCSPLQYHLQWFGGVRDRVSAKVRVSVKVKVKVRVRARVQNKGSVVLSLMLAGNGSGLGDTGIEARGRVQVQSRDKIKYASR
jgi:hypothetical protein